MIKVAAAIIEKNEKFLICKRGPGGNCEFLWEFPGGKLEEGETPFEAISREIEEELSVKIEPLEIFCEYPFSYPEKDIYFYFIHAKLLCEEIKPNFHTEIKWVSKNELSDYEFCPADLETVKKLKEI